MVKKRLINRLISKIVFAGLLVGMLPVHFSANAQTTESVSRAELKMEVDREFAKIKKTVKRLRAAKIAVPSIIAGASVALLVIANLVAAILFSFKYKGVDVTEKLQHARLFNTLSSITAVVFASIVATVSIGAFFGLSSAKVAATFRGARKLEEIEKIYPGLFSPEQQQVLAQLKKQSTDTMTQAIIKNLRLEDALKTAVAAAIQKNPTLLGGQRKARRVFAKYIKLRWQKELFKKALAEAGSIKKLFVKMQLRRVNRKLVRLERRHGQLKEVLKGAVQQYASAANEILQELKEQLTKGRMQPEMELKTVVPLPK